jgi:hypothetical protein
MKVSTSIPFQIIYSLFQHEYLGYLFESFVVQLDEKGKLTYTHQNISSKNANEFKSGLDDVDFELIRLMDEIQQDAVIKFIYKKSIKPRDFFLKVYNKEKPDVLLQERITKYLESRRSKILPLLSGKMLFEMGNDGEPTWRRIEILEEKASVLFHFMRNDNDIHYFPTIKYKDQKVEFQYKGAYIICNEPAWMVVEGKLYNFAKNVDGKKFQPFLNKKFIVVPKSHEEQYYKKFVAPLVASFDVYAKGLEIKSERFKPKPVLVFSELAKAKQQVLTLYGTDDTELENVIDDEDGKLVFNLHFQYDKFKFSSDRLSGDVSVSVEKEGDSYVFHRVKRDIEEEDRILKFLKDRQLEIKNSNCTKPKSEGFEWIKNFKEELIKEGFHFHQNIKDGKKYFIGESFLSIEVKENIDWFDVYAMIRFGPYEIPFQQLVDKIRRKQMEFTLPNGEIAVIPQVWLRQYSELFAFIETNKSLDGDLILKKHHLAVVEELEKGELATVTMTRKLEKLKTFEEIEDFPIPAGFTGSLRPYQKAGYNWLQFLNKFNFGGCLADDMGLGKTVQTLAMLQYQKEAGVKSASLLVMPTSLIYNWELEASKFTPELKVFIYGGTNREKNVEQFQHYDLILTSYGIARIDIDLLSSYYFNYIILDESQAIKNPGSNIARSVRKLNSKYKLVLTGTPIENSTLDLWSQMTFVNPGLLGNQTFFKNEFVVPIEKRKDEKKKEKLYHLIKPFILRRHKSQVATDLPEKIEKTEICKMSPDQEEKYEEIKSMYRNKILENIESSGLKNSQFLLLQGLTMLRQVANHPKMLDEKYTSDSGKMESVLYMLESILSGGHKILIFSQFVKHLTLFKDYLIKNKINFAYLDGSTKDRQEQVEKFQNEDEVQVFLISLKAGGLGLNLTKAEYVFILDPWWNPAIEAQAVDRAYRIGQKNKVITYKFITKGTVEEKILSLQKNKLRIANDLITTEDSFVKNLTQEDIALLFE